MHFAYASRRIAQVKGKARLAVFFPLDFAKMYAAVLLAFQQAYMGAACWRAKALRHKYRHQNVFHSAAQVGSIAHAARVELGMDIHKQKP